MWEVPKNKNGDRECVMCGGIEGFSHWSRDCIATQEIAKKWMVDEDLKIYYQGMEGLKKLAAFLEDVFIQRNNFL